jgi:hypothetical protein
MKLVTDVERKLQVLVVNRVRDLHRAQLFGAQRRAQRHQQPLAHLAAGSGQ